MKLQHLVVTRLTMKLFYEDFSPEWLEERLRLFRTYCVPGMAAQTVDDYQWLVLCDEETDPEFVEQVGESRSLLPQLHVARHLEEARRCTSPTPSRVLPRGGHRAAHHHSPGRR